MIVAMDLNASPVPEEDEDILEEKIHVQEYHAPEERIETGADIARREREERKRRLKRERPDDRPVHVSQSPGYDKLFPAKNHKSYDKSRLPPEAMTLLWRKFWWKSHRLPFYGGGIAGSFDMGYGSQELLMVIATTMVEFLLKRGKELGHVT
ncbi:unnamed protein product [Sphenostylis stenocarpa]|uniref:Uncharacterized protein n=1 Tax=Sphenostylis stenocarpa TaxID=92480 RepID=A0AA86SQE8_9FABA|nr:unnamed protein product [Sphenostylis stenocarpa]